MGNKCLRPPINDELDLRMIEKPKKQPYHVKGDGTKTLSEFLQTNPLYIFFQERLQILKTKNPEIHNLINFDLMVYDFDYNNLPEN